MRRSLFALTLTLPVLAGPALADTVTLTTDRGVTEAMDALAAAVSEAGATVFARVDHAEGARSVDMSLPEAQLLVFGNPQLGTQAMQDDIRAGLVLPLRVLIYDDDGETVIIYEEVDDMFEGLEIDGDAEYLGAIEQALRNLTTTAGGE